MGLKKIIGILFGVGLLAVAIGNVEFGMITKTEPKTKLILTNLGDPACSSDEIKKDMENNGGSHCVEPVGKWEGADIMLAGEGAILLFVMFWPKKMFASFAKRIRKITVTLGIGCIVLAVLDRFELLPSGADSQGLAVLIPFVNEAWMVQILLATIGILLVRPPKYIDVGEGGVKTRSDRKAQKERKRLDRGHMGGGVSSGLGKGAAMTRFTRTRDYLDRKSLLDYEDGFEKGMVRERVPGVRTCAVCGGAGCTRCRGTGRAM